MTPEQKEEFASLMYFYEKEAARDSFIEFIEESAGLTKEEFSELMCALVDELGIDVDRFHIAFR